MIASPPPTPPGSRAAGPGWAGGRAALALFACASVLGGCSSGDERVRAQFEPATEARPLPPLPRGDRGVGRASIGTAGSHAYVAIRHRTRGRLERVTVWRLVRRRWVGPVGGRRLRTDRGAQLDIVDRRGAACMQTEWRRTGRVWCLRRGRWASAGPALFRDRRNAHVGQVASVAGRLFAVVYTRPSGRDPDNPALGMSALQSRTLQLGRRWRSAGGGELVEGGAAGRVSLFAHGHELCAFFDDMTSARAGGPSTPRLRCLREGSWTAPELEVPAEAGRFTRAAGGSAGAGGRGLGVLVFPPSDSGERAIEWRVLREATGDWEATELGVRRDGWLGQGVLLSAGRLWALTFEQRPLPSAGIRISATLRLRTLGDDGRVREVGPPLLDDREIHGPISYGLARAGDRLYVLYPSPDDRARHNDVRVAEVELR